MTDNSVYPVSKAAKTHALIDKVKYEKWYKESVEKPDAFWGAAG